MENNKTPMKNLFDSIESRGIKFTKDYKDFYLKWERGAIEDARQDGHDSTYAEYGETPKCYLDGSNESYFLQTFKND